MSITKARIVILVFVACLFSFGQSALAQTTFTALGDLSDGRGAYPQAISANGSVVVGFDYYDAPGGLLQNHAFVWSQATGMQALFAGGLDYTSAAFSISADGLTIGGWHALTITEERSFIWSAAAGEEQLATRSGVLALSANGAFAAGYIGQGSGSTGRATIWDANRHVTFIDPPNMSASHSLGISADGSIVVGWGAFNSTMLRAFRWTTATGMVNIGSPDVGGPTSHANAITPDGQVIVGDAQLTGGTGPAEAVRWISGGQQSLGTLAGDSSSAAYAVSADGRTLVGSSTGPSGSRAFVWRPDIGMRDLLTLLGPAVPPGWTLTEARGVSADGLTIVGSGYGPSVQAWIATIPACVAGDLNGDGVADGQDIQSFVDVVFATSLPPGALCAGDFDHSGIVDLGDVPQFVTVLLGM